MPRDNKLNTGIMFLEETKEQSTWADFRGTVNVDGKEYYINGWKKKGQSGKKFISLSVKPQGPPRQQQQSEEFPPDDW